LTLFKSDGKDKAAIQALKAEGFRNIEAEAQAHYKSLIGTPRALVIRKQSRTRAALYEIINEES